MGRYISAYRNAEAATRAWTEWRLFLALFSAVVGDGFADEWGGAGGVFVDVILKTLVGDVHLAETGEDFVGAGVVVLGDVILQFFHQSLCLIRVGRMSFFHTHGEFGEDGHQSVGDVLPFLFAVSCGLFRMFLIGIRFAPTPLRLRHILFAGGFIIAVIKCRHCNLSFLSAIQRSNNSL